ncbi:hypothetical protein GGI25_001828 [Coemansia spiralis]|uniref:Prenyltransferase alpha-alpha toroid domain-containing protein n=2 Tax=Coemansia TaxID=4863 RepID=A0A9W8GBU4_9FUNG|nr:terpenoid cyclases/protein prenyltransferase alpha-alpha toroid [Coemansia spiralis]KAJ1993967.1 hypothetical protein EDC05_001878 [Coemansia umbellata]KAJ2622732.1 hypothetical protein GGI26_003001 [Coemansia sp. RSA 1358]KAJ2679056.1 hypothetical protein GGI25_001828 [Coemansia spiralis]
MASKLAVDKHVRYFRYCLDMLPSDAAAFDAIRMTLAHLCLAGLAGLGQVEAALSAARRREMVEWIYAQQIPPTATNAAHRGFRGGSLFGPHELCAHAAANSGNVAATYSALCSLLILGDDLARVDRSAIIGALRRLQLDSGTFAPHPDTTESDPRFIFCACAISAILGDWSGVDTDAVTRYIVACCSFDGGLTQAPFQESHGGHLYCCIASLALMGRLDALPDRSRTLRWAVFRQNDGYQGRMNKAPDACYSFWVGASVEMLGGHGLVDADAVSRFLLQCESPYGGIAKYPGTKPDPLHAALGVVGYAFCYPDEFPRMAPELLLPESIASRLLHAHHADEVSSTGTGSELDESDKSDSN